ncbi:hypothetical protein [Micromonospora mirobrigensis]|uniref:Uncharacterized protein n=1 Tax=Micromonospora mirobrigensis TaxID=262898 RepID=A0A1C4W7M4_9ACTN|nr:hypothetical protein [Micromonospora mirobrigensis]SCE92226.1 hypothetical protein GA0070564_10264 [Micromonospora mirobrigensis]
MAHPVPQRPPRRFHSDDILSGRVNLDPYPFRYIMVTPSPGAMVSNTLSLGAGTLAEVDRLLAAVEFLETRNWELVNLEQGGLVAFLRRRYPAP